jgi:UDP-glucuronate 4-epimerase
MKILVTGGAGFIGSHLINALLDKGYGVVCVDNLSEYYDPGLKRARLAMFKERVDFYQIDIADYKSLEEVFNKYKFDRVAHLAAQAGVRYSLTHPQVYTQSNYVGTSNLLEIAAKKNIKGFVFASTSSVYGESENVPFGEDESADRPMSMYAATKRGCEILAASYAHIHKLNVTCLRFFTVYGPWGRPDMALFKFTENILQDKPIDVYNNGQMQRDFTYVADIVDGFVAALEKPLSYEVINLGHGHPVHLMKFIEIIEKELGKKALINFMPMQPGDVPMTYADTSKAAQLLGFAPKVGVEVGVPRFVEWYKEYHQLD